MLSRLFMTSLLLLVVADASWGSEGRSREVFPSPHADEYEKEYWLALGKQDLEEALQRPRLTNVAKNVILFLGDGMGITVSTASRIFKGQQQGHAGEEGYLAWERFPHMGLMKTYTLNRQVTDSAGAATSYLSGVKGNHHTLGVTGKVQPYDCPASLVKKNRQTTVLEWAQEAGKETGFVTNTQVTHATPGSLYAKSASRKWQCDTKMNTYNDTKNCKDIARQLVEDEPGKNIKVIMGGGRLEMGSPLTPGQEGGCPRSDGRNLVEEWKQDKESRWKNYTYVTNTRELRSADIENTDFVMGLFADVHMPYEIDKTKSLDEAPHIKDMVEVAIRRLNRSDTGFFLLVEGGTMDISLHHGMTRRTVEEVVAFEEAVQTALKMVDLRETLFIVTADHSHVLTINGYPPRGHNILGMVETDGDVSDGLPYTTLMFSNGPGYNYSWDGEQVVRRNLTGVDTTDKDFLPQAGVPTYFDAETHGGEDVAAFAIGPMGHLFHRVHEQTYVAHVMGYAACIGPYKNCDRPVDAGMTKVASSMFTDQMTSGSPSNGLAVIWVALVQCLVVLIR